MSTTLQGPATELTGPSGMSVAVIGPNTAHRKIVAKALGGSSARTVREFTDYPAKLSDVPRMVEQNYDVVMIDVDSDQSYALALIESIAELNKAMVVAYSKRNDPELLLSCMTAGAREFLPLPDEDHSSPEAHTQSVAQEFPRAEDLRSPDRQSAPEARMGLPTAMTVESAPHPGLNEVPLPEPAPLDFNAWDLAHLHPVKPSSTNGHEARNSKESETAAKKENHRESARARSAQPITTLGLETNSRAKTVPELFAKSEPSVPELFIKSEPPVPESLTKSVSWLDAMDNVAQTTSRIRPKIDRDAVGPTFHAELEEDAKPENRTMYWVILSAGSGLLVGLVALVLLHPFGQTAANAPAARPEAPQVVTVPTETQAPRPVAKPAAATARTVNAAASAPAEPVSSEMMDAQLAAPSRITSDMKKPIPVEEAPPAGFSPSAMDDGASVPGPVFGTQAKVKVEPALSAISAGVAEGMAIHKTAPVYPQFAKDSHLSGTVILGATISKVGTIQGLHVISGPSLFRNPAMEAVKTWRYRPYMLDNQPVAVDTTVKVVFSMDQH